MVRIISKEEFIKKIVSGNVYVADLRTGKVFDPWKYTLGDTVEVVERNTVVCFEVEEEDEG